MNKAPAVVACSKDDIIESSPFIPPSRSQDIEVHPSTSGYGSIQAHHDADEQEEDKLVLKLPIAEAKSPENPVKRLIKYQCNSTSSLPITAIGALLLLATTWILLYLLLGKELLPEGGLFELSALVIVSQIVGSLISFIKLPPLLGMLLTGIVAKSCGLIHLNAVYIAIIKVSRDVALTVILIKAGLGLDPVALRAHVFTILTLAIGPCLAEAVAASISSRFILDYPWLWCFLLGFLLSPISPAVVVPTLLNLKEKGYGEDKGIATLVIAASSIDDIFSISLFGIFLSLIFKDGSSDSLAMQIAHGPLEVVIGILGGIVWGLVCAFLPNRNDEWVQLKRSLFVGLGGLVEMLGTKALGFSGAGSLAVITSTLVAAICWRQQESTSNKLALTGVPVVFSAIWLIVQPILFSLIGAMIDVTALDWPKLALSFAILCIALCIRVCACVLVTFGSSLNWKEKLFVNLAWLPKATVQAALSPLPLQAARTIDEHEKGEVLLTTAILAILVTAPIGAIGISLSGPRLLGRKLPEETDEQDVPRDFSETPTQVPDPDV